MRKPLKTILCVAAAIALSGCVSPEVVSKRSLSDDRMSCSDIRNELAQLDTIRAEAEKGKTVSGANVAAAVLFWPAVIGNVSNANQAIEAANVREAELVRLARQRNCSSI